MEQLTVRAPIVGGNFAVWGGLFAVFDCTLATARRKEDPWNSILAGAATGGLLAARAGPKAAAKNAFVGGVLLALIEGFGILMTKMMAPPLPSKDDLKHGMPFFDVFDLLSGEGAPTTQPGLAPPIPYPTLRTSHDD